MKFRRIALVFMLVASSALVLISGREVLSGGREGNGGDHVRGTFIRMGLAIIRYLQDTTEGVDLVKFNGLVPAELRAVLTIEKIKVVDGELKDNGGSIVDATGQRGEIKLRKDIWLDHFERERDVYYLVFHEMLRAVGVNDDNFIISKSIQPFPGTQRVTTRLTPVYPLIAEDLLQRFVPLRSAKISGSGCQTLNKGHIKGTYLDFDSERNIIELTPNEFTLTTRSPMQQGDVAEKNCSLTLPFAAVDGGRIVIAQLDINARVAIPPSAYVRLNAYLSEGERRSAFAGRDIRGYREGNFGRMILRHADVYKSPCGKPARVQLDIRGISQSPTTQPSFLRVDRISLYLRRESCDEEI